MLPKMQALVQIAIKQAVKGKPNAKLGFYRSGKGYVIRPKTGPTSKKDPVSKVMNDFLQKYEREQIQVKTIYSSNSRIIRGSEHLLGVKLTDGTKGWVTDDGKFIGKEYFQTQVLRGLDHSLTGKGAKISLEKIFETLSPAKQARVVDALRDVDWDAFWDDYYPTGAPGNYDKQFREYREILNLFAKAAGIKTAV